MVEDESDAELAAREVALEERERALARRGDELEERERELARRGDELDGRERELVATADSQADLAATQLAARGAELEQREAALQDLERQLGDRENLGNRERRLRRAAESTVAALHGEAPEPERHDEGQPEVTFSEGIQALAQRRREGSTR